MEYLALKHVHMSFVALSGGLFVLRGIWMLLRSPLLERRWTRIVPPIIDTGLLVSAISLAVWSHQYPLQQNWLTAKIAALIVYIALGTVALKPGRPMGVRAAALASAIVTFLYIVSVATTKQPLPFLS